MKAPALVALLTLCGCAAEPQPQVASSEPGAQLYQSLCSSCHGRQAHGDGPIAPLIKIGVPDLTLLAQRNHGMFPADDVRAKIDGRQQYYAHGARDMPVWGWRLYDGATPTDDAARARTNEKINLLVDYLQSLQR